VIPARGRVRVALAHDARMEARRIGAISGFDLSSFNRLASPFYQVGAASPRLELRSEAADLFDFDFQSGGPWPEERSRVEVRAQGRPINGIVQWIALDMDEVGRYENRPGGAASSWAVMFHPFPAAVESQPGQSWTIFGRHDGTALRVWGKSAAQILS
jgi:type II protein arginine methyltransferase